MAIEPDTKDWTWVLDEPCPECGFDASAVAAAAVADLIRENAAGWALALAEHDVAVRPAHNIWSTLEYACHVRDVHRVFGERLRQMLEEDDPLFANWDQDTAAIEGRYDEADPQTVAGELTEAAAAVAAAYASVGGDQWDRPGRRSNGSTFTVGSIARYHLHDVVHHLADVRAKGR